jgi:hypothetical protein
MGKKYITIFFILNIYIFKEIILKNRNFQTAQKNSELFLSCSSCNVSVVHKISNSYILPSEIYKKEKLKKVNRV